MTNGPHTSGRCGTATAAAPTSPATAQEADAALREDPALREAVAAVEEAGGIRDEDIPTAADHPFAPRTLTRAMARRARAIGLQLPKPRLRGVIHLIAFPTVLVAGLLLVAFGHDLATRLACVVFIVTAGMLFGISATYHRGTWAPQHAIMLRRFDHANIFLIIAGTYTPISIALLDRGDAITLLSICWAGAGVGVAFRLFWTGAPRWLYVPAYVALGWVAVFYMPQLLAGGGWAVVWLLIAGGLAYTLGALVYGLKRPDPSPVWFGFHEIFHTCTVAGFVCHFVAVALSIS